MEEETYCSGCGVLIKKRNVLDGFFNTGEKSYKFNDGSYCEKCARIRVTKRRSNI